MRYFKYIFSLALLLTGVSCVTPFDLDIDEEPIIFLESFPGMENVVTFRIMPAYSKANSSSRPEFSPRIHFTVNGNEVQVSSSPRILGSGKYDYSYYVADHQPVPGDKMRIEVSSEGFNSIVAETVVPEGFPQRKIDYRKEDVGERSLNVIHVIPDHDPQKYYAYGLQILEENTYYYTDTTKVYVYRYAGDQISDGYDMAPESMAGIEVYFDWGETALWKAGEQEGYYGDMHMVIDSYMMNGQDSYSDLFVHEGESMQYDDYGNEIGMCRYLARNKLVLYTMTEELYKYAVAQELIDDNAGFIAGLAPSNFCYSNVTGGYGVFAGVTCVETDWITPEFIENNR